MASLFEIGKTGVQAYRQSLSVTGQNIANINTEGYNKRDANVSEIAGVSGGATNVSDQTGLGVRVDKIRRSFNTFLADKTRTTTSDYNKLVNNLESSKNKELKDVAEQFEAIFVHQMLKQARQSKLADGIFSSEAQDTFNEMLDVEYSSILSKKNNFGIAEGLIRQFSSHINSEGKK